MIVVFSIGKAGKKVFVIRRQQVDTPNQCNTWHTSAAAMAYSPAFAGFVILLAVPPHSSRQLLCPSPHFVHFFLTSLDSASLHPLHSSSIHFSQVQSTRCLLLLCSPAGQRLRSRALLALSLAHWHAT